MPRSLSDPFPAMLRRVSGSKMIIATMTTDDNIKRKIKIDLPLVSIVPLEKFKGASPYLKPRKLAMTPPRTGPAAMLKFRTAGIGHRTLLSGADTGKAIRHTGLVEADETASLSWRGDVLDDSISWA